MSRLHLQQCKRQAVQEMKGLARSIFVPYLRRYGVCASRVAYDHRETCRRLQDAVYLARQDKRTELAGETDGDTIWVVRDMDVRDPVEPLLHEALHDSVFIIRPTRRGIKKGLSCDCEHRVMRTVGL